MTESETEQLKDIMKEAFKEVIISNRDLIYSAFFEAMEDYFLLNAIKEGELSGSATREEVFAVLEAK